LHGFLGLIGYYGNFVKNVKIAASLTALLKKNTFTWTLEADHSFHALKDTMCMTPILALSYFIKTFFLECDALGKGIGAILMGDGQPLGFTRKQLSDKHLGQSIYEKKFLAILHAMDL